MARVSQKQVDAIATKWRDLPPIERELSVQDTVRSLAKEIMALQKRGYTHDQIVELFKQESIELGVATLKNYMQRAKQTKAPKPPTNNQPGGSQRAAPADATKKPTEQSVAKDRAGSSRSGVLDGGSIKPADSAVARARGFSTRDDSEEI